MLRTLEQEMQRGAGGVRPAVAKKPLKSDVKSGDIESYVKNALEELRGKEAVS
jgi:hypothetical protein